MSWHGHLINADTFAAFGHTPAVKMEWPISTRAPQASLRGGELEVMFAQALEERPHCLDVSRRVGVEDDDSVELGRYLFQTLDNLVDDLHKPPWRGAAALGHDEPQRHMGVPKRRERDDILVHGNLMERRNQVKRGKHLSLA